MRATMNDPFKSDGLAASRPVAVFLRHARPGRIVLEFILPGADVCCGGNGKRAALPGGVLHQERLAGFKDLPPWLEALLFSTDRNFPKDGARVFGDLLVCENSRLVKFGDKVIANLTAREMELLVALAASSPAVICQEKIISEVWKTAAVPNLVHTHVFNLRRKLPPQLAARIQAVPGKGFRYCHME